MTRAAEIEAHPIIHGTRIVRRNTSPDTELILRSWRACPNSRALSIGAKCIQHLGTPEAIRSCSDHDCALFRLRPFQRDVEPRGAPHIDRHDFEVPAGLDPSESEDSD